MARQPGRLKPSTHPDAPIEGDRHATVAARGRAVQLAGLQALSRGERLAVAAAAAAVLLTAAWLRFFQLGYGLPTVVDVDAFKFVGEAARMAETGQGRPRDFQYPGGYTQILRGLYLLGIGSPEARHLAARGVAAACGMGLVVAGGLLAWRLAGPWAAIIAAALLACSPGMVTASRTAAPDTLVALWVAAGLLALVCLEPPLGLVAAGACAGLAAGTKYNGAVLLAPVAIAAAIEAFGRRRIGSAAVGLAAALVAAGGAFWLTTPYLLAERGPYLERLRLEFLVQRYGQIGHVQRGWFDYLWSTVATPEQPWLGTSLGADLGPLALAAGLAGIVWALSGRAGSRGVLAAALVVAYLAAISGPGRVKALRFLVPVLPVWACLCGAWVEAVILTRIAARVRAAAALAAVLVLSAWPAAGAVRYVWAHRHEPTGVTAHRWAAANIAPGSRVFVMPFYLDNFADLPFSFLLLPQLASVQYRLPEGAGPSAERDLILEPGLIDALRAENAQYLVLHSYVGDAFGPTPDNLRWFPRATAAYAALEERLAADCRALTTIPGWSQGRLGPEVRVFELLPAGRR